MHCRPGQPAQPGHIPARLASGPRAPRPDSPRSGPRIIPKEGAISLMHGCDANAPWAGQPLWEEEGNMKRKWLVYICFFLVSLVVVWNIQTTLRRNRLYRSTQQKLQALNVADVTRIIFHLDAHRMTNGFEITGGDEIGEFLAGVGDIQRYYPSHDGGGLPCLVTVQPANIQFTLNTIDRYPGKVLGRFTANEASPSVAGPISYGCFLSGGLYPWFQRHAKKRHARSQ